MSQTFSVLYIAATLLISTSGFAETSDVRLESCVEMSEARVTCELARETDSIPNHHGPSVFQVRYDLECLGQSGLSDIRLHTDLQIRRLQYESNSRMLSIVGLDPLRITFDRSTYQRINDDCPFELEFFSRTPLSDVYP